MLTGVSTVVGTTQTALTRVVSAADTLHEVFWCTHQTGNALGNICIITDTDKYNSSVQTVVLDKTNVTIVSCVGHCCQFVLEFSTLTKGGELAT